MVSMVNHYQLARLRLGGLELPPGRVHWDWLASVNMPEQVISLVRKFVGSSWSLDPFMDYEECSVTGASSRSRKTSQDGKYDLGSKSSTGQTTLYLPGEIEYIFDDVDFGDLPR